MEDIIGGMIEKTIYYKDKIGNIDEAYELIRFTKDLIDKFAETINCPSNWRSIGEELAKEYKLLFTAILNIMRKTCQQAVRRCKNSSFCFSYDV